VLKYTSRESSLLKDCKSNLDNVF